jgi:hypothetical protein
VASYSGTVYIHDGKQVALLEKGHIEYNYLFDWGEMENGTTIHDMMARDSRLYFSTDEGISVLRGMTWYNIKGNDGLPYEDTTTLAHGFDRDIWIGTTRGAIRSTGDDYHYFGYADALIRQKRTFHPGFYTRFDDRLAFYGYYPFLNYETAPHLRSIGLRSLERSWEVKRIEGQPWFNFIYGALTGNDCEADRAVAHLREWTLDLRRYSHTNSHRDDLHTPQGYRAYVNRRKPFSMREISPNRWDGDFMRIDENYGGNLISDPSGWLDAYWMGRYYGMISVPKTDDPALTTVPHRGLQLGAEPYNGPARPKLKHEQ